MSARIKANKSFLILHGTGRLVGQTCRDHMTTMQLLVMRHFKYIFKYIINYNY